MSQKANLQAVSDLSGLVHEIFVGDVMPNISVECPTAQIFEELGPGEYRMDGEKIVGAVDFHFTGGAMATAGELPDHQYADPNNWEATPAQMYVRRAINNFVEARGAAGPGAFEDLFDRIVRQQWDAFSRMQVRHVHGSSSGYVALCSSRTSQTVVVVKDGYGHTGTDPLLHIDEGVVLAWLDASNSFAVGGAAKVSSIAASTNTITFAGNFDDGSTTIAAGDPIVYATTTDTTASHFKTEYGLARNGLMTLVDPSDALTTVLGISEDSEPKWKPFREASSTFDHFEVTEHWRQLRSRSNAPVNPQTHICAANPAVVSTLAHSLEGFQTQNDALGRTFEGGYQAVRIAGMDIIEDDWAPHNLLYTLATEQLFRVDLNGEADYFTEDGSQFSRLADFDGKEWYVRYYSQWITNRRNRHAALTGITLGSGISATDYSPVR